MTFTCQPGAARNAESLSSRMIESTRLNFGARSDGLAPHPATRIAANAVRQGERPSDPEQFILGDRALTHARVW